MRGWWLALPLLAGCALTTLATKGKGHPRLHGEVAAGVAMPVSIHRDVHGVPHIRAERVEDAWYAFGWVIAEDRLFQADLSRRVVWGGLAEIVGERAAPHDVFVRGMGLRQRAEATLRERATPEQRALLVAFSQGMNDGAASLRALPVEHRLLGLGWEPWTPVDALAAVYTMSWTLAENPRTELASLALRGLDRETLDAALRLHPDDPPIDAFWDEVRAANLGELTAPFRTFGAVLGGGATQAEASNNWVIGPERSADGHPIVAGDPHLTQRVPSLWYAVDIQAGDVAVAGAVLPGAPMVVMGHNHRVAWTATNTMADVVDVALVERVGEEGYRLDGVERALERVEVTVPVRGGAPYTGVVYRTAIGPVITEVGEGADHLAVLRWHALEVEDDSLGAYHALARAGTVSEALQALDRPMAVCQSVVLGDVEGAFAWQVTGSMVRRKGHSGRIPYPASDGRFGWQGWLDDPPGERSPARGFTHSANARPDHPLAAAISTTYVSPWRHRRVADLLEAERSWTVDAVHAMQHDDRDLSADALLDALLPLAAPATDAGRRCHAALSAWDRRASADSEGATVFAFFQRALLRVALSARLSEDEVRWVVALNGTGRSVLHADYGALVEDRGAAASRALDAACGRLEAEHGAQTPAWGALHPLALRHPFSARSRALAGWDMPVVPWGGTGSTIMAASTSLGRSSFEVGSMQSMRLVLPLGDLRASTLTYPGGQSGQPGSPLYRSHFDAFVRGEPLPLWTADRDVTANTTHTRVLVPR